MTQIKAIYSMTYLPELTELKTKVNKWDVIKLKRLCIAKETISKVKRQPSEWEKIIANEATDKGLISKVYKQLTPEKLKVSQCQKKEKKKIKK